MAISLRARLAARVVARAAPSVDKTFAEQRAAIDRAPSMPDRRVFVDEIRVGGIPATQVRPKGLRVERTILHFHGGGFVVGSSRMALGMLSHLARATSSTVISIDYRLAPEHPYPAAIDDAVAAYRGLLEFVPAEQLALVGESAGGNVVMATLVRARDEGLPLPASAVVLSPWVDLTFSGDSIERNAASELLLEPRLFTSWRDAYVGAADPADPGMSPLFADLGGLPPLHVQATTAEVLEDDARRLVERARAAGVDVDEDFADHLWHVYQILVPLVPEATAALDRAAGFLGRHW